MGEKEIKELKEVIKKNEDKINFLLKKANELEIKNTKLEKMLRRFEHQLRNVK